MALHTRYYFEYTYTLKGEAMAGWLATSFVFPKITREEQVSGVKQFVKEYVIKHNPEAINIVVSMPFPLREEEVKTPRKKAVKK